MRQSATTFFAIATSCLTACENGAQADGTAEPEVPEGLMLFGDGYPDAGDACRRAGETFLTNQFLDDAADLVACPPNADIDSFMATTGGREAARIDGWVLISVPRR